MQLAAYTDNEECPLP